MKRPLKWIAAPFALALLAVLPSLPAEAALKPRSFTAGRYALELDGKMVGWLHSAEGGGATADVVSEPLEEGATSAKKHVAGVKYEDLSIEVSMDMGLEFFDWLHSFFQGQATRKNGAIIAADYDYKARSSRQFTNALITEVTIPALDGASKEPGYLRVTLSIEQSRFMLGDGSVLPAVQSSTRKAWLPANFRLKLGDLPCGRISKIDSFTVKQQILIAPTGAFRDYQKEPGKIEFPNVALLVSPVDGQPWIDWADAFLFQGKSNDGDELEGTLELLDPSLKPFATIDLHHVGMAGLSTPPYAPAGEALPRIKIELYVETMEFTRKP